VASPKAVGDWLMSHAQAMGWHKGHPQTIPWWWLKYPMRMIRPPLWLIFLKKFLKKKIAFLGRIVGKGAHARLVIRFPSKLIGLTNEVLVAFLA
jgi:hypothetical protein